MTEKYIRFKSLASLIIREMQIKVTLCFYLTSVKMDKIKEQKIHKWQQMLAQFLPVGSLLVLLVAVEPGGATMKINIEAP